jgi:hypothetical protein
MRMGRVRCLDDFHWRVGYPERSRGIP